MTMMKDTKVEHMLFGHMLLLTEFTAATCHKAVQPINATKHQWTYKTYYKPASELWMNTNEICTFIRYVNTIFVSR